MTKKVYITALHMMHGGVEMSISLISNSLIKMGYEVEILSTYNLGNPAYEIDSDVKINYLTELRPNRDEFKLALKSLNVFGIVKQSIYALKVLRNKKTSMISAIKNIEDGTIISTRNEHSIILSKYGRKKVRKIAQLHHDHCFSRKLMNDFKKKYYNIDYFVLLTEELREEVISIMKKYNSKTKCVCIPNFLKNIHVDDGIKKEKQIISVGRLHKVKGFGRLLDIWSIIIKQFPDWKLKIVGGGEEEEFLKEKMRVLGIENSVILTGELPHKEVMNEISKSSIFVMTSYSEGFPFVLIESLINKTPIVAFDVRVGPRAIVENEKEGYLIRDNDINEFVNRLSSLMDNKGLRDELSENSRRKAKEFMEEDVMKKWVDIL